jgi:activator of 2-hydroxyglutaryl-CoA dehydratase
MKRNNTEEITKKMASNSEFSEETIDLIMKHQMKSTNRALGRVGSVEVTGFGKFEIRKKKIEALIHKYTMITSGYRKKLEIDPENKTLIKRLASAQEYLDNLNGRNI